MDVTLLLVLLLLGAIPLIGVVVTVVDQVLAFREDTDRSIRRRAERDRARYEDPE